MSIEAAADFCPSCGGLIDMDTIDNVLTCYVCKNEFDFKLFSQKITNTNLKLTDDKEWHKKYQKSYLNIESRGKTKMTMN